ncbi:hypothetical protein BDV95DRAFT_568138, partial [Massariosphaeria phaeospora]
MWCVSSRAPRSWQQMTSSTIPLHICFFAGSDDVGRAVDSRGLQIRTAGTTTRCC